MSDAGFTNYGITVEPTTDIGGEEKDSAVAFSDLKKGFLLSKIDVTQEAASSEKFTDDDIAKIKAALGAEEIPDEEQEKFGMKDHPLHVEHLKQGAS
jgi:hypothetical protein